MSMPGGAAAPGAYPGPAPKVRFDVIGQAWQVFQQQMGTWVLAMLVFMVIVIVANFVLGMIPFLGMLVGGLPAIVLSGGLYRMALKAIAGEAVAVGEMFNIGDVIAPLIVAGILVNIGTTIGVVLCIIPGLLVAGMWMFTSPLIVDKGMDGVAAMRESWNALRNDMVMAALFIFVVGIVAAAGAIACGVGVLFTAPLAFLATALLYRDFFPEQVAYQPSDPTMPAPPPPVDPLA